MAKRRFRWLGTVTIPITKDMRGSKVKTLYARRPWVMNIIRRMQVLTGGMPRVTITMNESGTSYPLEHWTGWWSPAGWWRDGVRGKEK